MPTSTEHRLSLVMEETRKRIEEVCGIAAKRSFLGGIGDSIGQNAAAFEKQQEFLRALAEHINRHNQRISLVIDSWADVASDLNLETQRLKSQMNQQKLAVKDIADKDLDRD